MRNLDTADVGSTLRDMWETRPARPRRDRKVAGVAAAIARRYDIDPVLVRVGFAVAAVYGIGIALYVAGWLLLPAADEQDPLDGAGPRPASVGVSPWAWVILGVVLLTTGGFFWGDNGGFVLPIIAVLALLFLLHRSRGSRAVPGGDDAGSAIGADDGTSATTADSATLGTDSAPTTDSAPATESAPGTGGASAATAGPGTAGGSAADAAGTIDPDAPTVRTSAASADASEVHADALDRGTPPEWDPLGAAPFAWDLPEPASAEPEPPAPRRRSRVTGITLALALLGAGAAGVIVLLTSGLAGLPIVFATALAIVGIGLVIGSFARGGRGLIPFALLLAVLTWGSVEARVPLQSVAQGGVGDISVAPRTVAEVQPTYERGAGTIALDLSGLDTSVSPGAEAVPIRTAANVGMGEIVVTVPADADLTLRAHADLGDVVYGTTDQGGTGAQLTVLDDLGADGVRSGRPIELDLQAGLGSVEVRRG